VADIEYTDDLTIPDDAVGIARDPLPDEPAHALVFGKKTKAVKSRLAKGSSWVVPPPTP
jgi:hypothetical protein